MRRGAHDDANVKDLMRGAEDVEPDGMPLFGKVEAVQEGPRQDEDALEVVEAHAHVLLQLLVGEEGHGVEDGGEAGQAGGDKCVEPQQAVFLALEARVQHDEAGGGAEAADLLLAMSVYHPGGQSGKARQGMRNIPCPSGGRGGRARSRSPCRCR